MVRRGWYRPLGFSELRPETFLDALGAIMPRTTGAIDDLAAELRQRLPELFREAQVQ
jgi:hypothetical protein